MPQVFNSSVDGSERRGDFLRFDVSQNEPVSVNLGGGDDVVEVGGDADVTQVRLTFTSAQVGNGSANDSNTMANQDGGLAVRLQAENGSSDSLTGPVNRFDDEGISFIATGDIRFDVRDLVSGVGRGQNFEIVRLGTSANDLFNEGQSVRNTYINAGMGNDIVTGGAGDDFLVGGAGDDRLSGGNGADSFIGGAGTDIIFGGGGNDVAIFNVSTDGADQTDLGGGRDVVNVSAAAGVTQVRLTFTSAEVGNGRSLDAGTLRGQDGSLAVRVQAEDASGMATGNVGRFDDEIVTFVAGAGLTFDVRDLVSGVERGDQFQVATLGGLGNDTFDFSDRSLSYYVNAGAGNDRITGSTVNDFLVGGAGNDRIDGGLGNDSFIGGGGADVFLFQDRPGNDRILDFVSGTDSIDLRSYDIEFADLEIFRRGTDTVVGVDSSGNGRSDFFITLVGVPAPQESDFLL
ncbi:MAG TPA: calcium-binding protein [Sphingomonas sp.]|jgi:Ca2+-binding RTX toxin-like protein|uniref:calcium-binding protein n=1 Tax=Sphingomonas sp. TaxID=28214 RepID=UPI002ED9F473